MTTCTECFGSQYIVLNGHRNVFLGHLGARKQVVNTALTYYHLLSLYGELDSEQLLIYTSSSVSGPLMKLNIYTLSALVSVSTNS